MKNVILFFGFILLFGTTTYGQSKIRKAEESLTKKDNTSENKTYKKTDNDNSENDLFSEIVGEIFIQIFAYTVYGLAIESPFEYNNKSHSAFITKHPYYNSKEGNYSYSFDENVTLFRTEISSRYISENNQIKGAHFNLDLRFLKRLGLEVNYLQLWENNPNFGSDHLAIYTSLAKYYRIRTQKLDAWWGIGASYIDGAVNKLGFTYGLGAELFFAKPLSFEAIFNQTLVNSETVNKFNGLFNYHLNKYRMTVGYEHLKIGNQNFSMVTLGTGISF